MALSSKRELTARALSATGLSALLRSVRVWHGVLVLAYHRIGDGSRCPFDRGVWSATGDDFRAQLRCLKKSFDVLAAQDLADVRKRRSGRFVLVTFDDGYRDNHDVAFPILKSEGVPALFFLATSFLDEPRASWWDEIAWMVRRSPRPGLPPSPWLADGLDWDEPDRERAIRRLLAVFKALPGIKATDYLNYLARATGAGRCPAEEASAQWLTWDMVRAMQAGGMAFGGHTVNHPVLTQLRSEHQQAEIDGCARRLREELSQPLRWFSYPNGKRGGFNEATRASLRARGVELAFSYYGGCQTLQSWDPLDVPRVAVDSDVTLDAFRAMIALPRVFA